MEEKKKCPTNEELKKMYPDKEEIIEYMHENKYYNEKDIKKIINSITNVEKAESYIAYDMSNGDESNIESTKHKEYTGVRFGFEPTGKQFIIRKFNKNKIDCVPFYMAEVLLDKKTMKGFKKSFKKFEYEKPFQIKGPESQRLKEYNSRGILKNKDKKPKISLIKVIANMIDPDKQPETVLENTSKNEVLDDNLDEDEEEFNDAESIESINEESEKSEKSEEDNDFIP